MIKSTLSFLLVASVVSASVDVSAAPERRVYCSEHLIHGTYAGQLQGTQARPDGTTANIIGVVIRFYDGNGNIVQWDNVKNSVTGYTPDRYGTGTYRVNDDCTFETEFHPAPGVTIRERGVIMDEGREMRSITVLPEGLFVTASGKRI